MGDKASDLVQGTLDMLGLKTLALEPMQWIRDYRPNRADEQRRLPGERGLVISRHSTIREGRVSRE